MNGPTPDKVMQLITGAWAASILGAAARHGLFTALEGNPDSTDGVAKKTGISRSMRGSSSISRSRWSRPSSWRRSQGLRERE